MNRTPWEESAIRMVPQSARQLPIGRAARTLAGFCFFVASVPNSRQRRTTTKRGFIFMRALNKLPLPVHIQGCIEHGESDPANPLIAWPLYLAHYIENLGTEPHFDAIWQGASREAP